MNNEIHVQNQVMSNEEIKKMYRVKMLNLRQHQMKRIKKSTISCQLLLFQSAHTCKLDILLLHNIKFELFHNVYIMTSNPALHKLNF